MLWVVLGDICTYCAEVFDYTDSGSHVWPFTSFKNIKIQNVKTPLIPKHSDIIGKLIESI